MILKKPTTIEGYINAAPKAAREKLHQMHECIRAAAPDAVEGLKWSMPAYSYKRILVTFASIQTSYWLLPHYICCQSFRKTTYKI